MYLLRYHNISYIIYSSHTYGEYDISGLQPKYNLPGKAQIRKKIMPNLYKKAHLYKKVHLFANWVYFVASRITVVTLQLALKPK